MIELQANSLLLVVVGLAVLVSLRLVYRGVRPLDDQVHLGLRAMGWTLVAMGLLSAVELVGGLVFGPLFWFGALMVAGIMANRYNSAEQNALLSLLAISAEKQIPLAPAVESFAAEWGGLFGHRAMSLARLLRSGLPLADCLERERNLVAPIAVVAARVGTDAGVLGPALREAAESRTLQEPLWHMFTAKVYYLFCVLLVAQTVTVFMLIRVVPRIQRVFGDFSVELPAATEWMLEASESMGVLRFMIVMLVLELLMLMYLTMHFLGLAPWGLPGLERFARRLDAAVLLRSLAWVVEKQQPLNRAVELLARWYPKWSIRRRLAGVGRDMARGVVWREALRSRGLIGSTDAAVLAAAERVGNLPWALREMAASGERRLAYRIQVIMQWLYPLIMLWLGMLAFGFVSAYFLPLVQAIQAAGQ